MARAGRPIRALGLLIAGLAPAACGGAPAPVDAPAPAPEAAPARPRSGGPSVESEVGALDEKKAQQAFEKAIVQFREATAKYPRYYQAYSDLGFALRKTGDHTGALEAYDHAALGRAVPLAGSRRHRIGICVASETEEND